MLHIIFLGIIIGFGLAMPVGPITLEITRRNLTHGFWYGMAVGFGASAADLTYILLLATGSLAILQHPDILRIISIIGSLILFWFGWQAITAKISTIETQKSSASLSKCFLYGYGMATFSPLNILFWASLTSQIASITMNNPSAIYSLSASILFSIWVWLTILNVILHITRHKISNLAMSCLNIIGGLILWGFALYGLIHVLV